MCPELVRIEEQNGKVLFYEQNGNNNVRNGQVKYGYLVPKENADEFHASYTKLEKRKNRLSTFTKWSASFLAILGTKKLLKNKSFLLRWPAMAVAAVAGFRFGKKAVNAGIDYFTKNSKNILLEKYSGEVAYSKVYSD